MPAKPKRKTASKKKAVGRPRTEGTIYATMAQCEKATGVTRYVMRLLLPHYPDAFPAGGRVKWDKLPDQIKEVAAMASGNSAHLESKEELEKQKIRETIEWTRVKRLKDEGKLIPRADVSEWVTRRYTQVRDTLLNLFATFGPKVAGLNAGEAQKRCNAEVDIILKALRDLHDDIENS